MRILDKYLTREFLKLYFIFVFFFIAIFLLTDFFTSIGSLQKEATASGIIQYYLSQIPYYFTFLSPLSVIISTLFVVTHLAGTYQIQAAQIGGISLKRTVFSLLTLGLIIGFAIIFLNETLTFKTNQLTQKLAQENFLGPPPGKEVQKNIFVHVPPSYFFYIRSFNPGTGEMENLLIYNETSPSSIIIAKKGKWIQEKWVFYEGREYLLEEAMKSIPFQEKSLPLNKEPAYFTRKYLPPEKMSIIGLIKYINEYKESRFETSVLETELNFKFSYPFTNFILLFLGIPIGLILRKGGRGTSFGLGLIISFGYYEIMALSKAMGKGGFISPFFAAWIPNLIFLAVGIYLFTRTE